MNYHYWTPAESNRLLELRSAGYACAEVAAMLQRTEANVRRKLLSLGYSTRKIVAPGTEEETPESFEPQPSPVVARAAAVVDSQLRRQRERLELEEAKQGVLEDRILKVLTEHWRHSPPEIKIPHPISNGFRKRESATAPCAVAIVGDVHVGKTVDPNEVPLLGTYNPAVAVARMAYLEMVLLETLTRHPVERLYVVFAGDMIEGHLGHALQDNLTPPIALQFDLALSLLSQFLPRLAAHAPETQVYSVVGNHGRMLGERRMPTTGRWSNFDGLLYRALCGWIEAAGANHIRFDRSICSRLRIATPHHVIQVQHGDEIRGGTFGSTGLSREYLHAAMRSVHTGATPPDIMILGDKHISAQIPVGPGHCIYNGSFVGVDAYSMGFPPSRPSQTMLYLYPDRHETHVILLDRLPDDLAVPYRFKPDIEEFLNQYRHD